MLKNLSSLHLKDSGLNKLLALANSSSSSSSSIGHKAWDIDIYSKWTNCSFFYYGSPMLVKILPC
jgi:hypothetical protein